jgi:transcriptional regulator with PAS, ATPase and Fis domain
MSNGSHDTSKIDFSDVANENANKHLDYTPKHLPSETNSFSPINTNSNPTIILNDEQQHYEVDNVEQNLSLAEMEKNMILKALDKHRGKRRDAALDLGISERTLYRKIKEYELED